MAESGQCQAQIQLTRNPHYGSKGRLFINFTISNARVAEFGLKRWT